MWSPSLDTKAFLAIAASSRLAVEIQVRPIAFSFFFFAKTTITTFNNDQPRCGKEKDLKLETLWKKVHCLKGKLQYTGPLRRHHACTLLFRNCQSTAQQQAPTHMANLLFEFCNNFCTFIFSNLPNCKVCEKVQFNNVKNELKLLWKTFQISSNCHCLSS